MAKIENDELLGSLQRRSALAGLQRSRQAARRADREFFAAEEQDSVNCIARVLGDIDSAENRTGLETRVQQLEEHLERLAARPDDGYQALESKIHLLRKTIESALEAVGAPSAATVPSSDALAGLRTEFESRLMEARSDLRFEILQVQKAAAAGPPPVLRAEPDPDELREEFSERINACEERVFKATADLEALIRAQGDRLDRLQAQQLELMERLSEQMSSFARTLTLRS